MNTMSHITLWHVCSSQLPHFTAQQGVQVALCVRLRTTA